MLQFQFGSQEIPVLQSVSGYTRVRVKNYPHCCWGIYCKQFSGMINASFFYISFSIDEGFGIPSFNNVFSWGESHKCTCHLPLFIRCFYNFLLRCWNILSILLISYLLFGPLKGPKVYQKACNYVKEWYICLSRILLTINSTYCWSFLTYPRTLQY